MRIFFLLTLTLNISAHFRRGGRQRVKVRRGWERGRGNLRAHPSICCGRIMDICYNKWAGWFYPNIRLAIIFPVLRKLKRWNPESEIQSFNNLCFVFNRRVLGENSHWPTFFYIHLCTIRTKQKLSWLHLTYLNINFQFGYKQRNKTLHYFSENNCCYKTR